ncbi:MAG: DUF6510 family protein [Nocardioidaceae bacterium]
MSTTSDDFVDGSVLAGTLSEVFTVDVTAATGSCTGCGRTGAVAELRVYGTEPGMVARCPGCEQVVLRVVRTPTDVWLDVRGLVALRVPLA